MTQHPPPDDVPEADLIEQHTPLEPDDDDDNPALAELTREADEADTVEQGRTLPADEEYPHQVTEPKQC